MGYRVELRLTDRELDAQDMESATVSMPGWESLGVGSSTGCREYSFGGTRFWLEEGALCTVSPSEEGLAGLEQLKAHFGGEIRGEDGALLASFSAVGAVQEACSQFGIAFPPDFDVRLAEALDTLARPESPDEDRRAAAEVIKESDRSYWRASAALLYSYAVMCGGDPEQDVVTTLATLFPEAPDLLERRTPPMSSFADRVLALVRS
tara:strand:+ start:1340 stop:1960 length:621 start_codon:yes stop_codon:yes gene_type:complete